MKNLMLWIGAMAGLASAGQGWAASTPSLVLQVPQTFYDHPVHLLQPVIGSWHNRGDAAAEVGLNAFQSQHFNATSCQADASGQALVVIEPKIFYNGKMGIYYSEITARVFTKPDAQGALGDPMLTIKGQGQAIGNITHNVELFTHRAYQQAFEQVISQLTQDAAFNQLAGQAPTQSFQSLCTSINKLTQTNMFF